MGTAARAQAGRDRARESGLRAARERQLRLDPDQLARGERIDHAVVDVEVACEERSEAEQAVSERRSRPQPRSNGSLRSGLR